MLREFEDAPAAPRGAVIDEATRFCLGCHEGAGKVRGPDGRFVRHPVGVTVAVHSGEIGLPLMDVAGTAGADDDVIGCLTCHQVHENNKRHMLRWDPSSEATACASCHPSVVGDRARR